jgi:hypothetical protein
MDSIDEWAAQYRGTEWAAAPPAAAAADTSVVNVVSASRATLGPSVLNESPLAGFIVGG